MNNLSTLSDAQLLDTTRTRLLRSRELDAELLLLLGEVDARQLYLGRAFSSMFDFCTRELGFSEDVACNRISVARMARRLPRVVDCVREGRVHLTGLRLLESVLTDENLDGVLAAAAGKSVRDIKELVARLAPQPPVPPSIRKLPQRAPALAEEEPSLPLALAETSPVDVPAVETPPPPVLPAPMPQVRRPVVEPLSAEAYRVELTVDRELKAKLVLAMELLRHRVDKGDLAAVLELALDLLIEQTKKERFGVGRKPRSTAAEAEQREVVTRHIPDAIKREVYERDGGQCAFVSPDGRRCEERGGLELDHLEGFARTRRHSVEGLRLACRAHNQYAADKLYGREFMQDKRRGTRIETGNSSQEALL